MLASVVAIALVGAAALFVITQGDESGDDASDGDQVAETDENYEALLAHLTEFNHRATGDTISADDAACMSRNSLGAVTSKRMIEAGVLDAANPLEVLEPDETMKVVTAAYGCLDDAEAIAAMAYTTGPGRDTWAPCLFTRMFEDLGRATTVEYYASQAVPEADRPSVLTAEEQTTFNGALSECSAAPTTTAGG